MAHISDPKFCKSHFYLAAAPTHRLLLKTINAGSQIQSLDFEASHDDPSAAVVNLNFPYSAPTFLTLGSCRGFMLLTKTMGISAGDLILWNPSTGAHKEIHATDVDWNSWYDPSTRVRQGIPRYVATEGFTFHYVYGFGYDASRDDYLFVLIQLDHGLPTEPLSLHRTLHCALFGGSTMAKFPRAPIEVLSVKTIEPSFNFDEEFEYMGLGPESASGLFLNHSLHWLVKSRATQAHAIIAFDLVERSLSEIPLSPDFAQELLLKKCHLRVLGDCLVLCYSDGVAGDENTETWVMKEYKEQASWTKSFVLPGLPICSTQGGGVLGFNQSGGFQKLDDKGELVKNMNCQTKGLYTCTRKAYYHSLVRKQGSRWSQGKK